jgi:hypothetical protein
MPERDHSRDHPERHSGEPRRDETAGPVRNCEPRDEQRQRVGRIATERDMVVVRELPDRRERADRDQACNEERSQKKRLAPRKSLVRMGTMRTSLREFGDSIICPFPIAIETWPTIGLS